MNVPSMVIKLPEAQNYLSASLHKLAESFLLGILNYNLGCLLDEHKQKDSIFLRELFQAKKNDRQREIEELHLAVKRLQHQKALILRRPYPLIFPQPRQLLTLN